MQEAIASLNAALEDRYRIERELGHGGMARVYLADDLRHERKVALKVLKPELAALVGADRFLAEIKTTANLQHPHILPLYDSGNANGVLYYVTPYVVGASLRQRLTQERQLPVEEAVDIVTHVAEALSFAHRQGVIHRDIKPANILLQGGKPLVSDFGIALALGAAGGHRLTETGLGVGTPHYMSPEQATADQSVGPATDVWALGCVLYEMLVGEPPYTGSTPQAVLGKIITKQPESVGDQRSSVPANVACAVEKALEKVPADRFATAQDFAHALGDAAFRHADPLEASKTALHRPWTPLRTGVIAGAAVILVGATLWALARREEPPERGSAPRVSAILRPPSGVHINVGIGFAISPDERTMVFSGAPEEGPSTLFRHDFAGSTAVPIPGTEGSQQRPFFSPDGQWVGFFDFEQEGTLKRIRPDGSGRRTLAPVPPTVRSGAWGEDGTIIANSSGLGGLVRIPENGGNVEPIESDVMDWAFQVGAFGLAWIDVLPGETAALGVLPVEDEGYVAVVPLDTGAAEILFRGNTPRYVATGHIVYWRAGALWAVPFDAERLEVTGDPVFLVDGVQAGDNMFAHFAVSEHLLVYRPGDVVGSTFGFPVWVDRQGHREPLDIDPGLYGWPRISPDGNKVALARVDSNAEGWVADIWVHDLSDGSFVQVTFDPGVDYSPVWTPDGEHIVFRSSRNGAFNLYWRRADLSDDVERLTDTPFDQRPYAFAPDGSLLFEQSSADNGLDLWTLPMQPGATATPLMREAFDETEPALDPHGDFIVYRSSELGYPEAWVRSFPDLGTARLVSTLDVGMFGLTSSDPREARSLVWSRDGTEIFYRSGSAVVRVPVSTEGTLTVGEPQMMFSGRWANPVEGREYDVSPHGQRFLMISHGVMTDEEESGPNELVVVQNWAEALQ